MTSSDPRHDIGMVSRLDVEAVGQPGQRRFRMIVGGPGGDVVVWLEKEDLSRLSLSIERLLEIIATNVPDSESREPAPRVLPDDTRSRSQEFQAGTWAIGYDQDAHILEFQAHGTDDSDDTPPRMTFCTTLPEARAMTERASEVYSAGRPRCPLCGGPIDEGVNHVCPLANGHAKHATGGGP